MERRVELMNRYGETIAGFIHKPKARQLTALVIVSHGFMDNKDRDFIISLCRKLEQAGIAAFRFDMPGCGKSGGKVGTTSYSRQMATITNIIDHFHSKGYRRIALAGHSMGGLASFLVAAKDLRVKAIVTLNAPMNTKGMVGRLFTRKQAQQALRTGTVDVSLWGSQTTMHKSFFQDLDRHDVLQAAKSIRGPVLFIQGTGDHPAYPRDVRRIFRQCPSEVKFLTTIPDADHHFRPKHTQQVMLDAVMPFFTWFLAKESKVVIALVTKDDKYLLLQRSPLVHYYPGYWNPVGGFLPDGEDIITHARREIKEETSVGDVVLIRKGKPFKLHDPSLDKTWVVHPVLFAMGKEPIKLDWESSRYRWVAAEDITSYRILPTVEKAIQNCR